MSTTTVQDFIKNQDVKKLAEDIVLGPQAEVLTMIEQFNNRWRTELEIPSNAAVSVNRADVNDSFALSEGDQVAAVVSNKTGGQ